MPSEYPMITPRAFWIIRFSSLGDIVICTSALGWLKQKFPRVPIYFVTSEQYVGLFEQDPRIHEVIAFDRQAGFKGFLHFLRHTLKPKMRDVGGHIIDLHNSLRSTLLRDLSPLESPIVIEKHTLARLWVCLTRHDILRSRLPLAHGIVSQLSRMYGPTLSEHRQNWREHPPRLHAPHTLAPELKQQLSLADNTSYIGIVPTAQWAGKRWPARHFVTLIDQIHTHTPHRCIVFGGRGDTYCSDIAQAGNSINATGKLGLSDVMAIMKHRCRAVIANDTGLMHMADALEVPTCAILGPTTRSMGYPPLGRRSFIAQRPMVCRPCSRNGSAPCIRISQRACLRSLMPQTVFNACARQWEWPCSSL